MDPLTQSHQHHSRREILRSSALALLPLAIPSANYALHDEQPMPATGGTDPFPIPWLDKNGSHNQPAGANLQISTISKVELPSAAPSRAWAPTIKEIGSRLAAPHRTTA